MSAPPEMPTTSDVTALEVGRLLVLLLALRVVRTCLRWAGAGGLDLHGLGGDGSVGGLPQQERRVKSVSESERSGDEATLDFLRTGCSEVVQPRGRLRAGARSPACALSSASSRAEP